VFEYLNCGEFGGELKGESYSKVGGEVPGENTGLFGS
jgi:hypothetical protein